MFFTPLCAIVGPQGEFGDFRRYVRRVAVWVRLRTVGARSVSSSPGDSVDGEKSSPHANVHGYKVSP